MARVVALLGDRYELEELIGAGGMGEVFRARDLLLERTVAVKRPSASFTGSSRERFRREARAAARLNHPHVVAVYDWGEDASVAERHDASVAERNGVGDSYIVMEHVEGLSLRAMLQDQGALAPDEVARVGAQIADALAHAHSKGVVHRDVKPSNVLVTTTGTVKVTDFGIAQSTASEALTEPGVVIGTAGYLAPEQVAGLTADARSDIYSLGVVLTELLTGAREVEGDVDDPDAPGELTALRRVIAQARAQDPADRYQRATEMREALRICARASDGVPAVDLARASGEARTGLVVDVPTATVAPLAPTIADATKVLVPPPPPSPDPSPPPPPPAPVQATPVAPVAPVSAAAALAAPLAAPADAPASPGVPPRRRDRRRDLRRARKAERKATSPKPQPKQAKPKAGSEAKRERRWRAPHVVWLVAAPVTLALVAAGFLAYRAVTTRPEVTVPSVIGDNLFHGSDQLQAAGLEAKSVDAPSATPAGTILAVRPRPGQTVREGDTVVVTFSAVLAEMPDVIDMSEDEAAATLRSAGLVNIETADDFTDDVAPGTVTASQPLAHLSWAKADSVTLSIARDPSVVIPTGIVNSDEATARGRLEAIGLVVTTQQESSKTRPAGTVLRVSPGEGSGATRGDTVVLRVSSGPKAVPVRYVIKEDANDAYDDLQDDGFVVSVRYATAASKDVGKVVAQDPAGGQAPEGSTVTITIGVR